MKHDPFFEALVNQVRPHIRELSIQEVKEKLDKKGTITLIDVREDSEWAKNRIPTAIHIGRGVLERDIATIVTDKNQELILYCGGGYRSALAAYNLQKMGYTTVYSMDGGIRSWGEQNYGIDITPK